MYLPVTNSVRRRSASFLMEARLTVHSFLFIDVKIVYAGRLLVSITSLLIYTGGTLGTR